MTTTHPVDEALARFELISGSGSENNNTACAMTALAWVAGDAWTDRPACASRLLTTWVIGANDATGTTVEQRQALVREGATGIIDTWWIPDIVLLDIWRSSSGDTRADRVIDVVKRVAAWKAQPDRQRPVLSGADLSDADLRGAVLSGAVLRGADLSDADLRGAVLRGADLSGAVLRGADLSGAVLSGAVLRGADLRDADLRGADLSDADLRGADLSGAVLSGADLSDADLRGADLSDADLRGAWRPAPNSIPAGYERTDSGYLKKATV